MNYYIFFFLLIFYFQNSKANFKNESIDCTLATPSPLLPLLPEEMFSVSAWIYIVTQFEKIVIKGEECASTGGKWFSNLLNIKTVCAYGIWKLSNNFCDKHFLLIAGGQEGDCYLNIKDKVNNIQFIGYPNNPYITQWYLATSGFDRFQLFPSIGELTFPMKTNEYFFIFGISPDSKAIQDSSESICWSKKPTKTSTIKVLGNPVFTLDKTEKGTENERYMISTGCTPRSKAHLNDSRVFPKRGYVGDYFYQDKVECVIEERVRIVNLTNDPNIFKLDQLIEKIEKKNRRKRELINSAEPLKKDCKNVNQNENDNDSENESENENEIFKNYFSDGSNQKMNELTKKMIEGHLKLAFGQKVANETELPIKEYMFLEKSKNILEKVCPNEEIDHTIYSAMMRFFKEALTETLNDFPQTPFDEKKHDRILKSLENCILNVPGQFNYNYNHSVCPKELEYINLKEDNSTIIKLNPLPCDLNFNLDKYEIAIEIAWKTMLLGYYTCAKIFKDNPLDLNFYYFSMESLINRILLIKWISPKKANDAYGLLFGNSNLTTFGQNLDKCVDAARSISVYKMFMSRPQSFPGPSCDSSKESDSKNFKGSGRSFNAGKINKRLESFCYKDLLEIKKNDPYFKLTEGCNIDLQQPPIEDEEKDSKFSAEVV